MRVSLLALLATAAARPTVREIRNLAEYERLIQHHKTETGLPVVVDFYSDSCGPCRMIAPAFKKLAKEMKDRAVFVATPGIEFSQLFFPIKGILVIYDSETGTYTPLPGADAPAIIRSGICRDPVLTNPGAWKPHAE